MTTTIAFQGEPGAFSELACRAVYPDCRPVPYGTFDEAFEAVETGAAERAMIPVENSVAGRVADIHHLLPESSLFIIAEHFQPVRHQALGPAGVALHDATRARSHPMALAQCRRFLAAHRLEGVRDVDTAAAARIVAAGGARDEIAIASTLAGELHGLEVLAPDIQDDADNTTRFVVMAREPATPPRDAGPCVTSFLFRVRNVPAALYKAMGGFATNSVNMTKLESYQLDGRFAATQFYADVEGHPDDANLARALEELQFFSSRLRLVGTYPAHPYRLGRGF